MTIIGSLSAPSSPLHTDIEKLVNEHAPKISAERDVLAI